MPDIEHLEVPANGLRLHVALAGPPQGPLVVLLHGFPEFWWAWRHQIGALAAAGWRVAAPDQRGYGTSDKPSGRSAYALDTLADDILALASALGHERFTVVGHDWGGIVAWQLAARAPGRIERAAILNAPHPATLLPHALGHPGQLLKSAYVVFFQMPLVPEWTLGANGHAALARALTLSSRPGTFAEADLARYREAWSQPGALTAMLNWYRAVAVSRPASQARIRMPVRIIWGDRDTALDRQLADEGAARCDHAEVFHIAEATHWVQHEEAARVNALLLEFLGDAAGRRSGA